MNTFYNLVVKNDVLSLIDAIKKTHERGTKAYTVLQAAYDAINGMSVVHVFEAGDVNVITGSIAEVDRILNKVEGRK